MGTPYLPTPSKALLAELPKALLIAVPIKVREAISIRALGESAWEIGHPRDTRLRTVIKVDGTQIVTDPINHVWPDWLAHRLLAVLARQYKITIVPGSEDGLKSGPLQIPDTDDPWPTFEEWLRIRYEHAISTFGEEIIWTTMAELPDDIRDVSPTIKKGEEFWNRVTSPPPPLELGRVRRKK
jgi:hypothetical protein